MLCGGPVSTYGPTAVVTGLLPTGQQFTVLHTHLRLAAPAHAALIIPIPVSVPEPARESNSRSSRPARAAPPTTTTQVQVEQLHDAARWLNQLEAAFERAQPSTRSAATPRRSDRALNVADAACADVRVCTWDEVRAAYGSDGHDGFAALAQTYGTSRHTLGYVFVVCRTVAACSRVSIRILHPTLGRLTVASDTSLYIPLAPLRGGDAVVFVVGSTCTLYTARHVNQAETDIYSSAMVGSSDEDDDLAFGEMQPTTPAAVHGARHVKRLLDAIPFDVYGANVVQRCEAAAVDAAAADNSHLWFAVNDKFHTLGVHKKAPTPLTETADAEAEAEATPARASRCTIM